MRVSLNDFTEGHLSGKGGAIPIEMRIFAGLRRELSWIGKFCELAKLRRFVVVGG